MPLYTEIEPAPSTRVFIWKIEENEGFFLERMTWSNDQLSWINTLHPLKKIEHLASRYLIYSTLGYNDDQMFKDEHGKLLLKKKGTFLSLSHSGEWVGLGISDKDIGFDLQFYTDKIFRMANRYLSDEEYAALYSENHLEVLTAAWCIKEAVYKCYGKKSVQYNRQIKLRWLPNQNAFSANAVLMLHNNKKNNYIISYGTETQFAWAVATCNS